LRDGETNTEIDAERRRQTQRYTNREGDTERKTQRHKHREILKDVEKHRKRYRETNTDIQRETNTEIHRETEKRRQSLMKEIQTGTLLFCLDLCLSWVKQAELIPNENMAKEDSRVRC
jgi:hypothetical protein